MKLTNKPTLDDIVKVVNYNDSLLVRAVTADTELDEDFEVVLGNAAFGNIIITLPPVGSMQTRKIYRVKKIDATANTVTVVGFTGAQTIDGAVSVVLAAQWSFINLITNNVVWYKV